MKPRTRKQNKPMQTKTMTPATIARMRIAYMQCVAIIATTMAEHAPAIAANMSREEVKEQARNARDIAQASLREHLKTLDPELANALLADLVHARFGEDSENVVKIGILTGQSLPSLYKRLLDAANESRAVHERELAEALAAESAVVTTT